MAEKKGKKGGVNYCSAGGPNKVNCANKTGTPAISMHYFPKEESVRWKWTQFVRLHRKDFEPKKSSCLCSAHFEESCFEHKPVLVTNEHGHSIELKKNLIPGSVPTKDIVVPYKSPLTARKKRNVSVIIYCYFLQHVLLSGKKRPHFLGSWGSWFLPAFIEKRVTVLFVIKIAVILNAEKVSEELCYTLK